MAVRGVRFKSAKRGVRCFLQVRAHPGLKSEELVSPESARGFKMHLTPRFDLNLTPRTALALKVHEPYIRHEMRSPFS